MKIAENPVVGFSAIDFNYNIYKEERTLFECVLLYLVNRN